MNDLQELMPDGESLYPYGYNSYEEYDAILDRLRMSLDLQRVVIITGLVQLNTRIMRASLMIRNLHHTCMTPRSNCGKLPKTRSTWQLLYYWEQKKGDECYFRALKNKSAGDIIPFTYASGMCYYNCIK
ncbi:hypothetical protein [Phosphitispora sp. TUW77]|uniref:hypothetical protein n=1 Tax=Phosphitispora sp. TUW77 TaxID=3152361 RepID=UPI003AB5A89D